MSDDADLPIADQTASAAVEIGDDPEASSGALSRRQMLVRSVAVMGGAIGLGVGIPAAVYIAGPSAEDAGTEEWIRLGAASSIEPGEPTLMKANIERRSGYLTSTEEISVFVTTNDGQNFTALSNVCTHLGCRVRWVTEQNGFFCPCHNAVFNADGSVATGPPPRALDVFETKVEESQIFIRSAEA